jgi:hypothetical protein
LVAGVEIFGNRFSTFEEKPGWVEYNLTLGLGTNNLLQKGCQELLALIMDIQVSEEL